jgi:hypothetical protein
MVQATDSLIPSPSLPASPRPLAQSIGSGFMPVIYHPERTAEYTRFERIIRKTMMLGIVINSGRTLR